MARRRFGLPLSFLPSAVFNEDSKYGKLHAAAHVKITLSETPPCLGSKAPAHGNRPLRSETPQPLPGL